MNDLFSLKRFGLLLKKFTKEHFATYLLYLAALTGILLLVYGLTVVSLLNSKFEKDAALVYFVFGLLLMGGLFSSSFYSFFGNKAKSIHFINLPASHTEKLALGFLFTQVVFFLSFVGLFYCVDQLMVLCYNSFHRLPANTPSVLVPLYHAQPIDLDHRMIRQGMMLALVTSSACHFGSLCFEKNAFVKNALVIIVCGAVCLFYGFYSIREMIPEEVMPGGNVFTNETLRVGNPDSIRGIVYLPEQWKSFYAWAVPVAAYVLFWTASFFKLKEKQV